MINNKEPAHNQVIADIILEIKRSPAITSEQKYNEWFTRILSEIDIRVDQALTAREDELRKEFVQIIMDYDKESMDLLNEAVAEIDELKCKLEKHAKALLELIALKQIKDMYGKTPDYELRQPKAWETAFALFFKRTTYEQPKGTSGPDTLGKDLPIL